MDQPSWASDFALRYIGQDTEDLGGNSETDRDLDPNTWDIEEEFRSADGPTDAPLPFYARIAEQPSAVPRPQPESRPRVVIARRTAWLMLLGGIAGLVRDIAVVVYACLQAIVGLLAIAFLVICLYLLTKFW